MHEQEIRNRLRQIIDDIDAGRLAVPAPPPRAVRFGVTLAAAAVGIGLCGCPSQRPTTPPGPTPSASTTLPPVQALYAAPYQTAPGPGPTTDPGAVPPYMAPQPIDTGARPLYAAVMPEPGPTSAPKPVPPPKRKPAPVVSPDPGAAAEYMAPGPGPAPPIDTGPRPLYAIEPVPLH